VFAHLIQDPKNYIENPAHPPEVDAYGQLSKLASTFSDVDGLFYFTYLVCIFFFVLITGVLLYSVVVYRRKTFDQPAASNVTHNTPLEVVWTVIPLIIVMVMFAWGFRGSLDMLTVPADARWYKATAKQWNWTFNYPNSAAQSFGELWLEKGKNAAFVLESSDVLHAFFMPEMRVKRDVIPGRNQTIWFHPTEIGEYHLFCAEYCGNDHSKMYAKVHVVSAEEYATKPWDQWDDANPAKGGESVYKALCSSCHTVNGMPLVGPSWKGLFVKDASGAIVGGQREVLVDGVKQTITVDQEYISESIKKPDAKKAFGFEKNNMTAFPALEDKKILGVIEYMKTLAAEGK
jgi:cytochrome c oxidase subunit II